MYATSLASLQQYDDVLAAHATHSAMGPGFPLTQTNECGQKSGFHAPAERVNWVSKDLCRPLPGLTSPVKLPQYLTEPDPVENDADILESMLSHIAAEETSPRTSANGNPTSSHNPSPIPSSTKSLPTLEAEKENHAGAYVLELDPELDDEELELYISRPGAQTMLKEVRSPSLY